MKPELLKELEERRDQLEQRIEADSQSSDDLKIIMETLLTLNRAVIALASARTGRKSVQRNIGEKMVMHTDSQPEIYLSERWDDF